MNFRQWILVVAGLLLQLARVGNAQSFCGNNGGFIVNPLSGCAPLTVKITNTLSGAENITYSYNFDRNSTGPPGAADQSYELTHTYNTPGTYTILQYGSIKDVGGFSECKDVVVKETRAPNAELIACENGKARLTVIDDSISQAYDELIINWGDGTSQQVNMKTGPVQFDHSYPRGTLPPISIRGNYTNSDCAQKLVRRTLTSSSAEPVSEVSIKGVEMLPTGEARILYIGKEGVPTEVLMDNGSGQFAPTGQIGQTGGTQRATISGLDPKRIYRFRLASRNICDEIVESPIVSSITIASGSLSLDEIISVSWTAIPASEKILQYQLKRDGAVVFTTTNALSYQDTGVKCGNKYKYEIVAIIEDDVRSYSAPIELEPKTATPATISRAVVSVTGNNSVSTQVQLTGEGLTSSYNLIIERTEIGSANFQQISPAGNQSLQFADNSVNTAANSYCYRFLYENACNMRSPDYSQPVCSILLTNKSPELSWTTDSPFTQPVGNFDLMQLDNSGNQVATIPKALSASHTVDLVDQSSFSYRIEAQSADGSLKSVSNTLNFRSEPIILIPDAFTPNGDAHNERFEVKAYFVSDFQMSVYSRWGEVVYHTSNPAEGWDGRVSGEEAAGGYYLYQVSATDNAGKVFTKKGSFLLIR